MDDSKWSLFCKQREIFKQYCIRAMQEFGEHYIPPTAPLQKYSSFLKEKIKEILPSFLPQYSIDTPIVYNHNFDLVKKSDEIALILVGDNPGKEEQQHAKQAYLVGQAGRIAEGFFRKNKELNIDFRRNVLILNKTILHTPKTLLLKELIKKDERIEKLFLKDMAWQAGFAILLQQIFACPLWIVGYSQLTPKGLFISYRDTLIGEYSAINSPPLFLYQHFSMNCFIKQLNSKWQASLSLSENLKNIGATNRSYILGF